MKPKLIYILPLFCLIFSGNLQSQEIAKERTVKYIFELNAIKYQSQVDGISNQTKNIKGVQSCVLNWLEYKMEVIVKEGGNYGNFSMEKIKSILLSNDVQLKRFTKEAIN